MFLIITVTQSSFSFHFFRLVGGSYLVHDGGPTIVLITISDQHGVNKDGKIPYCAHSMFATKEFILLHPLAKVFEMVAK